MKDLLKVVYEGGRLPREEAGRAMQFMLQGEGKPEQVAAFLTALHVRGETFEELAGFLGEMRARAIPVPTKSEPLFDICGTGGDGAQTFNISTAAAFVVAAAGVKVAKHGNRSVSSRCGSADVIEALGLKVDHPPALSARAIDEVGFGFLFAPHFHPALAKVAPIRRALEMRTFFNLLGPLANPARVRRQVVGVYDKSRLEQFALLLRDVGIEEAMIVSSEDGLDEVSLGAATHVAHLKNGEIKFLQITPEEFGLSRAGVETLSGGDAKDNARLIRSILSGETTGPKRDIVVMNAALGLVVTGKAKDLREGAVLAAELLKSGKPVKVLDRVKELQA